VDLLANRDIDILLASLSTPSLEGFLRHEVILVVGKQDSRDLRNQSRVVLADEALGTTEEGLLVTLRADHLLEQAGAALNLLGDLLVEDTLGQHSAGFVLAFNAELLGLHVDIDIADLSDITLFGSSLDNPATQLLVSGATVSAFVVAILDDESALEVVGEILGTSLHGFLGNIDGPVVILNLRLGLNGLSLAGHLIVAVGLEGLIAILPVLGVVAVARAGVLAIGSLLLLALTAGLLLLLLATLGVVANNEGAQLEARVDIRALTASLAVQSDSLILDVDIGLGVLALLAKHKLGDKAVKVILELGGIVGAVDDPTFIRRLGISLGTELKTEVLDEVGGRTAQRPSNRVEVDDNGLDTVALALDLGLELLHLVAVEGIGDIPANVNGGHDDGLIERVVHENETVCVISSGRESEWEF